MNIKILVDGKVAHKLTVKDAKISEYRSVIALYKNGVGVPKPKKPIIAEMVPSIMGRVCIDYEVNKKPNSMFYTELR